MRALATGLTIIALVLTGPQGALVQAQTQTPPPPQVSPPVAQPASAPAQQLLSDAQLDALVSPIALYPDALLSEILMASTYPLEVVEADRWATANKNLKGDSLKAAVDQQSWDDSVKSLVATPDVLDMMSTQLSWTQQLGDAVLAQQADVMDAVQRLRSKAQANDKLASNSQQTVSTQQQNGKQVIVVAPTQPQTIYVPYYNPAVVYGPWPYPAYPPYYWPAPGYIAAGVIATGLAFGAGYALGRWVGGGYWGGGVNWSNNNININRNVNINNINRGNGNNWVHNPAHRQGVRYNNPDVANKFGGNRNSTGGAQNRMDFRGRAGNQVLSPGGGNRPNVGGGGNTPNLGGGGAGNRASVGGGGNAPNLGGGAGNRANVGGGGNRPNVGAGGNRPNVSGGNRANVGGRENRGQGAFGNVSSGRAANAQSARGRASLGGGGGGGGGGGHRGGGGGGGGHRGGGGGRRSDVRLKHDITLLGHLPDGLGFYRFVYNGGRTAYVGVMAQEVQTIRPDVVTRGSDGYLRVDYDRLGLKFQTYEEWVASGAHIRTATLVAH